MTRFLLLALRNVFRNRRRTALTLLIVSGGVTALLLAGGFFAMLFEGLRESTITNGLGHLQIYDESFFTREEKRPLDNGLDDVTSLSTRVAGLPHVVGVAPRIEFFGMVSNGSKSPVYMAMAVDPDADERMGFRPQLRSGRSISSHPEGAHEVLLGEGLARSLEVKPGDGLTMLAVTADGALNGIDVVVVGTFTQGFKEMDDRALRLTVPAAQQLLDTTRVTKLVVGLDHTDRTEEAARAVTTALAGHHVTVKKWQELSTVYQQVVLMFGAIFLFMCTIVFFMVVLSSANTMLMSVFERTREIGAMLAMGTPRTWITGLLVTEGLLTGALGAFVGVLLGTAVIAIINAANIQVPALPGNSQGFPLHVMHVPALMAAASLLVIATLAVASVFPAIRASRLRIVVSLAHV